MKTTATRMSGWLDNQPAVIESLDIEVEQIDVTAITEPNMTWEATDSAGHWHAYAEDGTLPTLYAKAMRGPGPPDDDDPAAEVTDDEWTEMRCRICDEHVVPGSVAATHRKMAPGRKSWSASVLTDPVARMGDSVVLRVTLGPSGMAFGVAQVVAWELAANGRPRSRLVGNGPLGQREIREAAS